MNAHVDVLIRSNEQRMCSVHAHLMSQTQEKHDSDVLVDEALLWTWFLCFGFYVLSGFSGFDSVYWIASTDKWIKQNLAFGFLSITLPLLVIIPNDIMTNITILVYYILYTNLK